MCTELVLSSIVTTTDYGEHHTKTLILRTALVKCWRWLRRWRNGYLMCTCTGNSDSVRQQLQSDGGRYMIPCFWARDETNSLRNGQICDILKCLPMYITFISRNPKPSLHLKKSQIIPSWKIVECNEKESLCDICPSSSVLTLSICSLSL